MSISVPFFATHLTDHPFPNVYAWVCGPHIGLVMQSDEYKPRMAFGSDEGTSEQMEHCRENEKTISFHIPLIRKVLETPEDEEVRMDHVESGGMSLMAFHMLYIGLRKEGVVKLWQGMLKMRQDGQMGVLPMYHLEVPEQTCHEILEAFGNMKTILAEASAKGQMGIKPNEVWEAMKNETT